MHAKLKLFIVFAVLFAITMASAAFSPLGWHDFLDYFDFWKHTLLLGMLLSFLLGETGFWLIARQSVYSGLALSSSSIVGLLFAAVCCDIFAIKDGTGYFTILLGMALGVAIYLFGTRFLSRRTTNDAATAVIYVACTSITIILSNNLSQGHHELENLLFGNSVMITDNDFRYGTLIAAVLGFLGIRHAANWLHLTFDPLFQHMSNAKSKFQGGLLNLFVALTLVIAAKNFGMLTTFAIMLFPALTAYGMSESGVKTHFIAGILAAFVYPAGFIVSFFLDQPTGACICLVGLSVLFSGVLIESAGKALFKKRLQGVGEIPCAAKSTTREQAEF